MQLLQECLQGLLKPESLGIIKMRIPRLKIKYLFSRTFFRVFPGANVNICSNVEICRSKIIVSAGATLSIAPNVRIKDAEIYVERGSLHIDGNCIIQGESKTKHTCIVVNDGQVSIGNHSKVSCDKIWVRFGGALSVGEYTNINQGSEIRCDESITIGSFNQISYHVRIWDTNTHSILEPDERRRVAKQYYPYYGYEESRPQTRPIVIGNDCWLGEGVAILKGSCLGDRTIIGFQTTISGQTIPAGSRVVPDIKLRILST